MYIVSLSKRKPKEISSHIYSLLYHIDLRWNHFKYDLFITFDISMGKRKGKGDNKTCSFVIMLSQQTCQQRMKNEQRVHIFLFAKTNGKTSTICYLFYYWVAQCPCTQETCRQLLDCPWVLHLKAWSSCIHLSICGQVHSLLHTIFLLSF
jgi:hypothetical protein